MISNLMHVSESSHDIVCRREGPKSLLHLWELLDYFTSREEVSSDNSLLYLHQQNIMYLQLALNLLETCFNFETENEFEKCFFLSIRCI